MLNGKAGKNGMTMIQLECFMRAAASLSFTEAASQMFISRQVVSAHVKALEEELGYPLFVRGGKSISLTPSGAVLFRELDRIHEHFSSALKNAAAQNEDYQEISIGICEMTEDWHSKLHEFAEEHPNCQLNVEELPLYALESGLITGKFDVVISLYDDLHRVSNTGYGFELLQQPQLTIALAKKHPLAQRDTLGIEDLQNECLCVVSEAYSGQSKSTILGHFDYLGCRPREVREFPNYKSLEIALGSGGGVTVAFDLFLENRGKRLKLYPIVPLVPVRLAIAYKQDSSNLVKQLTKFLKEHQN